MKYLQNEARKQKSVKEVTLQFSVIFQIRLKITTSLSSHICMPFNNNTLSNHKLCGDSEINEKRSMHTSDCKHQLYA